MTRKKSFRQLGYVYSAIALVFISSCAPAARPAKSDISAKLAHIPLSDDLQLTSTLERCDDERADRLVFETTLDLEHERAGDLWDSCQALYACSPTAKTALQRSFSRGESFALGLGSLQPVASSTRLSGNLLGLYVSGGKAVYLDSHTDTPLVACALLLHELIHRFDKDVYNGQQSLATEYKAYWYQQAFSDELVLDDGRVGRDLRDYLCARKMAHPDWNNRRLPPLHSRQSLMLDVSTKYHYTSDEALMKSFAELPNVGRFACGDTRTVPIAEASPRVAGNSLIK